MNGARLVDEGTASFHEIKDFFGKTNFFSDLEDDDIEKLAKWLHVYSVLPGTNIFTQGNIDASLCFIVSGEVLIFKETTKNEFVKISNIGVGGTIGEMSIIDGQPLSASAIASEKTMVLIMTRSDFEKMVEEDCNLGIKILWRLAKTISLRLRETTGILAEVSTPPESS